MSPYHPFSGSHFTTMASENGIAQEPSFKVAKLSPLFRVKRLSPNAILPSRASPLSAGYDLFSAVDAVVPARGQALIPTDLSITIPQGTYGRIESTSDLAWKYSVKVGSGVIDPDYLEPVVVVLFNLSNTHFDVKRGDRIAQMIMELTVTPDEMEVEDLDETKRGEGGFGSTGV